MKKLVSKDQERVGTVVQNLLTGTLSTMAVKPIYIIQFTDVTYGSYTFVDLPL